MARVVADRESPPSSVGLPIPNPELVRWVVGFLACGAFSSIIGVFCQRQIRSKGNGVIHAGGAVEMVQRKGDLVTHAHVYVPNH